MHVSEYLLGYPYLKAKHDLIRTEYAAASEHQRNQQVTLAVLLDYAVRKIPFYRERLGDLAGRISQENALERLQAFPLMTKEDIRAHLPSLYRNTALRGIHVKTGGSSGDCLPFVSDRFVTRQREKAFIWNQWARVGYRPGDSLASFRGNVPRSGQLFDRDTLFNTFVFSPFDITNERIESLVSAVNQIKPVFLHAYPSTIFQIARLMEEHRLKVSFPPRAILCGSERLFDYQRKYIESFFESPVYSWYGHSECAVLGGGCEVSNHYHIYPQYGYLELLPADIGDETGSPLYEIVATGFNNWVMPFIRYKTADFALKAENGCSCGRHYPLLKTIVGRSQEFLVGRDDVLYSVTVLTSQFEKTPFIGEFLFTQKRPGEATLSIVASDRPVVDVLNQIVSNIRQLTQGRLHLEIELVALLPKTAIGKRVYVQQHLDLSKYLGDGVRPPESAGQPSNGERTPQLLTSFKIDKKPRPENPVSRSVVSHRDILKFHHVKTAIAKHIVRLPNRINFAFMSVNRDPSRILGKEYAKYRRMLEANYEHYDAGEQLLASVNTAIGHIPYYRHRYGGGRIASLEEFEKEVGFIDKGVILENFGDFIRPDIDGRDYDLGTTGGTSGKSMQLIAHKGRFVVEMATMHSLWERAGYRFDVRAVIRNHKLPDDTDYIINPITREVIFDGFRLNPRYFETIYKVIRQHNIRFVHCYPSHAYEFGLFLMNRNLDASFITAFLSGSENIFDYERQLIQDRLGIRFYNWYGHSEKLVLAGYCGRTNDYHIEPTYGYFELVDEKGAVIRTPGQFGEIVGTGFHNPGMIFIRYRTGDYAEYVGDRCSACGRRVPVIRNIRGRWNGNRLYNADGTFVTSTALNLHSDLQCFINGLQYIQERKGEVRILIVKSPDCRNEHESALYHHFRERFAPATVIRIEYVHKLLSHPNGKFVQVISTVNNPDLRLSQFY